MAENDNTLHQTEDLHPIQEPENLRDAAFSHLAYILGANLAPEVRDYWLQNANVMKVALSWHLYFYLRDAKGIIIDNNRARHLVEEYLIFKGQELGVV